MSSSETTACCEMAPMAAPGEPASCEQCDTAQAVLHRQIQRVLPNLRRYAHSLTHDDIDADDLVQECLARALGKLHLWKVGTDLRAWLFSILRNAYLRRFRASKQEQRVPLDSIGEIPDRPSEPLPEIDPIHLQKALGELPESFRTPLILFYFEEFSYREIAEQMEMPIGTVMSRLARGKMFLKHRLLQGASVSEPPS